MNFGAEDHFHDLLFDEGNKVIFDGLKRPRTVQLSVKLHGSHGAVQFAHLCDDRSPSLANDDGSGRSTINAPAPVDRLPPPLKMRR